MKKSLAIVTSPLAQYRVDLYEGVARDLKSDGWESSLIYAAELPSDHAWGNVFGKVTTLRLHHCTGIEIPLYLRKIIGFFKGSIPQPNLPNFKLWQILKQQKPDVIWIAEYAPYCLGALFYGITHGIPILLHTDMGTQTKHQVLSSGGLASFFFKAYQKTMGNFISGQVACTAEAMSPFNSAIDKRCLAPHAIDSSLYGPSSNTQKEIPLILFVGNLLPTKGIDYLAEACGLLKMKGFNFTLRFVGGAGDRDWADNAFKQADILDLIEFAGFREGEALRDEYRNASIFVLPSRLDTYGVVTHEATASGLPIVISKNAGSSAILVEDGKNGFIVEPSDIEALAAALEKLLLNPELREQFGKVGRAKAEEWSLDKMSAKVANFIRDFA